jgi:hypothetical protein
VTIKGKQLGEPGPVCLPALLRSTVEAPDAAVLLLSIHEPWVVTGACMTQHQPPCMKLLHWSATLYKRRRGISTTAAPAKIHEALAARSSCCTLVAAGGWLLGSSFRGHRFHEGPVASAGVFCDCWCGCWALAKLVVSTRAAAALALGTLRTPHDTLALPALSV